MEKRDLTEFTKALETMIALNDTAYKGKYSINRQVDKIKDYTLDEVKRIIESGNLDQQLALSRNFFEKDCLYRRIIIYYATLLKYVGIVIPTPTYGNRLSTDYIQKKYFGAVEYVDQMKLPIICTDIFLRVLIDGCYYGILKRFNKKTLSIMTLPAAYCVSRFKTPEGDNLIEFNVKYFDSITDEGSRKKALNSYPKDVAKAYRKYKNGKLASEWIFLDPEISVCFSFFETMRPLLLGILPACMDYDTAVDTEKARDLEEIRKIIVQKIPHLNDGQLLFEPDEVALMHKGAVNMLKGNGNVSVMTTYGDVDAIVSKTSNDNVTTNLDKMLRNVYGQAGVSVELFASTSNLTLLFSIKNDIAMMMILGHKVENFITTVINKFYGNANVVFKYKMLPVSIYTENDYTDEMFKLAQSGYSYLLPAIAMGVSQRELSGLKELENDVLELGEVLIPLASSYTQSGDGTGQVGRPKKDPSELSPKTEANEKAKDNSNNSE